MKKAAVIISILYFIFTILTGCGDELPPQIKHGEFPFTLKYELNGKTYVVNDTVICDFDGFDMSGVFGKSRMWKEHLKSGKDRFTILMSNKNTFSILEPERVNATSELRFEYGLGGYYMGDPEEKSLIHGKPNFCYNETYHESPDITHNVGTPLNKEQLQEYFGIKIIEWTFSEPIKNTFR